MSSERGAALDRLYGLLDELAARQGPPRLLSACHAGMSWPDAGVYFFFEDGEVRESGVPRLVRVGTHRLTATSKATLWGRLSQHRGSSSRGGNHRGSIFRLHVGTALIALGGHPEAEPTWGAKQPPAGARDRERRLERAVSGYIGAMPFLHVAVEDRTHRAAIEAGAIALLSNYDRSAVDPASPDWLGHHADRLDVRKSHLWNVRHVADASADTTWLDTFATCVRGETPDPSPQVQPAIRARPRRRATRAPQEEFDPALWSLVQAHLHPGLTVPTLGRGQPNTIIDVQPTGVVVETVRSASRGRDGELVPAWMFNATWKRLTSRGRVTRAEVLNELNVKRSSAVCALLATLPAVTHTARPVQLILQGEE